MITFLTIHLGKRTTNAFSRNHWREFQSSCSMSFTSPFPLPFNNRSHRLIWTCQRRWFNLCHCKLSGPFLFRRERPSLRWVTAFFDYLFRILILFPPSPLLFSSTQESSTAASGKIQDTPQYYVNSLKVEHSLETLRSLLVVLRSQPISWLKQFCDFGGVEAMLEILSGLQMVAGRYFHPFSSPILAPSSLSKKKSNPRILSFSFCILNLIICIGTKIRHKWREKLSVPSNLSWTTKLDSKWSSTQRAPWRPSHLASHPPQSIARSAKWSSSCSLWFAWCHKVTSKYHYLLSYIPKSSIGSFWIFHHPTFSTPTPMLFCI